MERQHCQLGCHPRCPKHTPFPQMKYADWYPDRQKGQRSRVSELVNLARVRKLEVSADKRLRLQTVHLMVANCVTDFEVSHSLRDLSVSWPHSRALVEGELRLDPLWTLAR